jgi:hypothetical protein
LNSSAGADWHKIERDYRAGEHSVSRIARENGVNHKVIRREAKRQGWGRASPEPMSEERRRAILATLGSPDDVQRKLAEFVKGIGP